MPRDYKHRAEPEGVQRKKPQSRVKQKTRTGRHTEQSAVVPAWRWLAVLALVAVFAYFLSTLSSSPQEAKTGTQKARPLPLPQTPPRVEPKPEPKASKVAAQKPPKPKVQFDFYTILPKAEFVVPDHEVKTRVREERVGKEKAGVQYAVQAGSFRRYQDADSLKAKLLLMGFSPKIEKAKIGATTWFRVKMGPYQRLASVDAIQSRLKKNNMDALVMEVRH